MCLQMADYTDSILLSSATQLEKYSQTKFAFCSTPLLQQTQRILGFAKNRSYKVDNRRHLIMIAIGYMLILIEIQCVP